MKLYLPLYGQIHQHYVYRAAEAAQMTIENLTAHASRYADVNYVIGFNGYGNDEVRSRRRANDRGWGMEHGLYAATWDQWGVLLSNLFALDPTMKVGGYKNPYYGSADEFHHHTGDRFKRVFDLSDLDDFHGDHSWRWSGEPGKNYCRKCSATADYSSMPEAISHMAPA